MLTGVVRWRMGWICRTPGLGLILKAALYVVQDTFGVHATDHLLSSLIFSPYSISVTSSIFSLRTLPSHFSWIFIFSSNIFHHKVPFLPEVISECSDFFTCSHSKYKMHLFQRREMESTEIKWLASVHLSHSRKLRSGLLNPRLDLHQLNKSLQTIKILWGLTWSWYGTWPCQMFSKTLVAGNIHQACNEESSELAFS